MIPRALLADAAVVAPLTLPSPQTHPTHPTRRVGTSRPPYLTGEYVRACIIWICAPVPSQSRPFPFPFPSPSLPSLSHFFPLRRRAPLAGTACSRARTTRSPSTCTDGPAKVSPNQLRADVYETKSLNLLVVRPLESAAQPPHEAPPSPLSFPLPPTRPPHRHAARGAVHAQQAHRGHALRRRRAASRVGHVDPHPALGGHRGVRTRCAAGTFECRSFHP